MQIPKIIKLANKNSTSKIFVKFVKMLIYFFSISLVYPSYSYVDDSVFDKGLTEGKVEIKQILNNYDEVSENQQPIYTSKGKQVLGFVTPWNKDGYRLAEEFGNKFSIIVPTWLFAEIEDKQFVIKGTDAVDTNWLATMKAKHPKTLIAPRLIFQINPQVFYQSNKQIFGQFRQSIGAIIESYGFDAIFLEVPNYVMHPQTCQYVPALVKEIRYAFGRKKGKVFCEMPTIFRGYTDDVGSDLKKIANQADLIYMSAYEIPGASAICPKNGIEQVFQWLKKSGIPSKKFMVGLPFFGMDFGGSSQPTYVEGLKFVQTLNESKVTPKLLKQYEETAYFYSRNSRSHQMFYPSLQDLDARMKLIDKENVAGFGIWELAQGLPYFFDLL